MIAADLALILQRPAAGTVVGDVYDISTHGMTADEAAATREYARRTNEYLRESGAKTVQSTRGTLRQSASAAARQERLRAARAGAPYKGQAGHVPDAAISGQPEPPAGWIDMPGTSNQCCGAGLASRIGKSIRLITVNGQPQ
jgi:hypothetical protein